MHIYSWWYTYVLMMIYIYTHYYMHIYIWWYTYLLMIICILSNDNMHIFSWWYTHLFMMIYISTHDDIHIYSWWYNIYSWWYTYLLMMIFISTHDDLHICLWWYAQNKLDSEIRTISSDHSKAHIHNFGILWICRNTHSLLLPLNVSTHYNIHVYSWWYTYLLMRIHTSTHNDIYITAQDNMHIWSW